ncbi:hypothetical protein ACOME3_006000 [Neoechinorhynchus agilis]
MTSETPSGIHLTESAWNRLTKRPDNLMRTQETESQFEQEAYRHLRNEYLTKLREQERYLGTVQRASSETLDSRIKSLENRILRSDCSICDIEHAELKSCLQSNQGRSLECHGLSNKFIDCVNEYRKRVAEQDSSNDLGF